MGLPGRPGAIKMARLLHHSGSYYEQHQRKKAPAKGLEKQRLMTDRSAYISYLEVQLERVSA